MQPVDSPAGIDLGIGTGRANSLITDVCELFLHPSPDPWMATSGWVSCLQALGVGDAAARTALHRMTKGGYLVRDVRGPVPGYAMSTTWRQVMSSSDASPTGRWLLVTFTVPEELRHVRHQLRTVLTRTGFGSLGNGIWIGSTAQADQLRRILVGGELQHYVDLFEADHVGFHDTVSLARRCWDLPALVSHGGELAARIGTVLRGPAPTGSSAFAQLVETANACRHFVSACPELPEEAQPDDWPVPFVLALRDQVLRRCYGAAEEFVTSVRFGRLTSS